MEINHTQNRLALIRRYLDKWASSPRHNRQLVAEIVVEKFDQLGLKEQLAGTGVEFSHGDDAVGDMRAHAQKLWRWLGAYEEAKPAPDKLWYLEQAIVAAMPQDLRLQYLRHVYAASGISVSHQFESNAAALTLDHLIKEQADAACSLVSLMDGVDPGELDKADKELHEALSATVSAINYVKALRAGGAE